MLDAGVPVDWAGRYLEVIDDLVIVADANTGEILRTNDAARNRLESINEELVGSYVVSLVFPADRPFVAAALAELSCERPEYQLTLRLNDPDASTYSSFNVYLRRMPGSEEILVVNREVTELSISQDRLAQFQRFIELTDDLLVRVDHDHRILACNRAFSDFAAVDGGGLTGQNLLEFFVDNTGRLAGALTQPVDPAIGPLQIEDLLVYSARSGTDQAFSLTLRRDDASASLYVAARDVTDELLLTAELRALAETDALTGLVSRSSFENRLQVELDSGRDVAIAFLDLDNFKKINDSLGHSTGDEMLKEVANRLVASVRARDVVARFGGDEFCVMLTDHGAGHDLDPLARELGAAVGEPMILDGRSLVTSCSIGIAVSEPGVRLAADLMKRADAASYAAKDAGRDRVVVFDQVLNELVSDRFRLEEELRIGIETKQLDIDIQGVFDRDRQLAGVEALLRWEHPAHGRIGPEQFLKVAEGAGLMSAISDQVITRAFETIGPWLRATEATKVAMNFSPSQLSNPALVDRLVEATAFYGVTPGRIALEITEEALVESIERTGATLRELRSKGFVLAMDDFGKGASSLGHLRDLPFGVVKIDRGFIDSIEIDGVNRAIVESVIGLATRLDMWVVAEGIESEAHFEALITLGCHRFQGYHLHRPEPVTGAAVFERGALPLGR